MAPRPDSNGSASPELAEAANAAPAGGAAPPQQGAPSTAAEAEAAGSAAAPERGAPVIELDERTKAAIAGQMEAQGDADTLEPVQCMVCFNHTFGPALVVTASCGHYFHPKCIEDTMKREKTKCPCGAAYPPGERPVADVGPVHKRMMNKHKVQCPQGCGQVMSFELIHEHIHNDNGCPNTPYRCCNEGCEVLFLRKEKDMHVSSCPHRLVPCDRCEQLTQFNNLQQHKAGQCPRRKISCRHCEGEYIFCDKQKHMRNCSGEVSMKCITELKEMMAQMQQTISQQQQTIEHQRREIADLRSITQPLESVAVRATLHCVSKAGTFIERHAAYMSDLEGTFEQGLAELLARRCIEQDFEDGWAELRRMEQQQEEAAWEQRERARLPQTLLVRVGCGYSSHEYTLRKERINLAAVWSYGTGYCIYRSSTGYWGITNRADDPQHNRGEYRLAPQPGGPTRLSTPFSARGWQRGGGDLNREDGWEMYAELSVIAR